MLGVSVGATTSAQTFWRWQTLLIVGLGLVAFAIGTASGVMFGKLMYVLTKGKVNPLIGSAGVSAVPMAARVARKRGRGKTLQISFLCTLWDRMFQVLSVLRLQLVYF